MPRIHTFVAFSLCTLLMAAHPVQGQELVTTLTCTANAKVSRDYGFVEKRWEGQKGHVMFGSSRMFNIETRDSKVAGAFYSLRDKVFSGLNTSMPIVRSITRFPDEVDKGEEFLSRVVSRTHDGVFLLWTNDFNNKVWLAAIDLTHRKATVTQVFQGVTSVGGELETLDCR